MNTLGRPEYILSILAAVAAGVAALAGLWMPDLYAANTASAAVQAKGQDLVTVVLAIPALIVALVAAGRGSMRAALAVAGILGYLLYTYASYAFLLVFTRFFLLHVAAFSLALFAFILSMSRLAATVPDRLAAASTPLRASAFLLLVMAAAVLLMWLAQIIPAMQGRTVPIIEESEGRLVIQALDVGVVVPAAIVVAAMVLRGNPLGLVWLPVLLVKFLTLGLAVVSMTVYMARTGTPDPGGAVLFMVFSALFLAAFIWLFTAMRTAGPAGGG